MAQLSRTAFVARQSIKWGILFVIVYMIAQTSVIAAYNAIKERNKPKAPPPAAAFGLLPSPDWQAQDPSLVFQYKLETISGTFPTTFPERVKVYINSTYKPNLLAYNRAVSKANSLGFPGDGTPLNPPMYRWRKFDGVAGLLELNMYEEKFDMILNWQSNELLFVDPLRGPINEPQIFSLASGTLARVGNWTAEWIQGQHAIIQYGFRNSQLVKVDHISKADFFQVNFQRKQLDSMSFVYADPYRPVAWALVSRKGPQIVELHFNYQRIDENAFTEYPIEPITSAWQQLINNKAYIANIGENSPGSEVIIRHFELAYYLSSKPQKFTLPVYVIKGDRGFTAYVPAILESQLIPVTSPVTPTPAPQITQ